MADSLYARLARIALDDPMEALREFLAFIRTKLKGMERGTRDREVS